MPVEQNSRQVPFTLQENVDKENDKLIKKIT